MTEKEAIQAYVRAADAAMAAAKAAGKWDKNTPEARAEVAAARVLRRYS